MKFPPFRGGEGHPRAGRCVADERRAKRGKDAGSPNSRAIRATEDAAPRSSVEGALLRAFKLAAVSCVAVAMGLPLATAEVVQKGKLRVKVDASIAPQRLPRSGLAPIRFALNARFISVNGQTPPQLRRIQVQINRHGHLDPTGLPICEIDQIQPATTTNALIACGPAKVGEGHFSANVEFTEQSPFPSDGKLIAYNGRWHGRPAILAHIYGPKPVPTSYTIPFSIRALGSGTYGTELSASLPRFSGKWGYVTGISMTLGRSFSHHGHRQSYLSAGCPAPAGIPIVSFPLSHASFGFAGHEEVDSTVIRSCRSR